jgi:hypothetical protein
MVKYFEGSRAFARRRLECTYAAEWTSGKSRANLARRRRALSRSIGADVRCVDRAAVDTSHAIEQFLHIEASGWKGRSGIAVLCGLGHDLFLRDVASGFAAQGRLMFLSLEAGERVLAQNIALIGGSGLFGFLKAYDETYQRYGPGSLLDLDLLKWFHAREDLEWLDSCARSDGGSAGTILGDRRPVCSIAVPLNVLGTGLAPLLPVMKKLRQSRSKAPGRSSLRATVADVGTSATAPN